MVGAALSWGTIYLIRHAEKPGVPDPIATGIDGAGNFDPESLTPAGWRRASAWAVYFSDGSVAPPQRIYASNDLKEKIAPHEKTGSHSKRPIQTVTALAAKRGVTIDSHFLKGGEQELVDAIRDIEGVALVCWQHEAIPNIARRLAGANESIPSPWPDDRFDVVWRLVRETQASDWKFDQICPQLISGDSGEKI